MLSSAQTLSYKINKQTNPVILSLTFLGTRQLQPRHCERDPGGQRDLHLPGQHRPSHQQGEETAPVLGC